MVSLSILRLIILNEYDVGYFLRDRNFNRNTANRLYVSGMYFYRSEGQSVENLGHS